MEEEKEKLECVTVLYPNGTTDMFTVGKPSGNTRTVLKIVMAPPDSKFDYFSVSFSDGEHKIYSGFPYIYSKKSVI